MNSKLGTVAVICALAFAVAFAWKLSENGRLKGRASALEQRVAEAEAQIEAESNREPDAAEAERARAEKEELIRLRGEVAGLRKEKAAWDQRIAADNAAAAANAARAAEAKAQADAAQEQQAKLYDAIVNAPPAAQGEVSGSLRKKLLSGGQLTQEEMGAVMNLMAKSKEIEKSPQDFGSFQTAFVSSLLGWQNDPRAQQVQQTLTAASQAALNRGFDYNTPSQNADKWTDQQKALNTRATGAVQGLLTPEERQIFDRAFIGVLGVDFGMAAQGQ